MKMDADGRKNEKICVYINGFLKAIFNHNAEDELKEFVVMMSKKTKKIAIQTREVRIVSCAKTCIDGLELIADMNHNTCAYRSICSWILKGFIDKCDSCTYYKMDSESFRKSVLEDVCGKGE